MRKQGICIDCGEEKNIRARSRCTTHYNKWLEDNSDRAWKKAIYPTDDELVAMALPVIHTTELSKVIGIRRESFRDYLNRRPHLKARVMEALAFNRDQIIRDRQTLAKSNWRLKNPDKVRAINRKWAKNQDPAKRAKWNSYNRERRKNQEVLPMDDESVEFASIVRNDPCSYCHSYENPTLEHVIPIELGGDSHWTNLAGACHSCNSSKNDTPLLQYLLREAVKSDTYVRLTS